MLFPGAIGKTVEILHTLNVEPSVIEEIEEMLKKNYKSVMGGKPVGTNPSAFGQSVPGGYLAHHTSVAEGHVVEAMEEMARSLLGYRSTIRKFAEDTEGVDKDAEQFLRRITDRIVDARINHPGGGD